MPTIKRKVGEQIKVGDDIVITLIKCGPKNATMRVTAPKHIPITRSSIAEQPDPITMEYPATTTAMRQ